ncbi:MAG TPA: histidinol-phosphate transaminase [Acetivibrio sp.]|nr:histidinol-phosphate transaminase [Acetivibrio sp.]HQA56900.1 histidinol-phosphate transaminase [Acetivibrio sp.]
MINELVRPEIRKLTPYVSHEVPYRVKLDANESPFELPQKIREKLAGYFTKGPGLNLYPDNESVNLRRTLAGYWNVDHDAIVVGAGSNQLIQLIITVFVGKGDRVVIPCPTFSMYKINTIIAGGIPVEVPLIKEKDFDLDVDAFIDAVNKEGAKVAFLCNPNNPTGGLISIEDIEKAASKCTGSIIVVDEAYAEFCEQSAIPLIEKYENLVVLRTFSKAYLLAGARCGYSISNIAVSGEINKIRPTFNLSSLTQLIAKMVFEEREEVEKMILYLKDQREYLAGKLKSLKGVYVYPSWANYILIRVCGAKEIARKLYEKGVLVRSFFDDPVLSDCIRISVGTKEQNDIFLEEFISIMKY